MEHVLAPPLGALGIPEEQRESISLSAVLVVLGFLLIALGVIADTRYKIV